MARRVEKHGRLVEGESPWRELIRTATGRSGGLNKLPRLAAQLLAHQPHLDGRKIEHVTLAGRGGRDADEVFLFNQLVHVLG